MLDPRLLAATAEHCTDPRSPRPPAIWAFRRPRGRSGLPDSEAKGSPIWTPGVGRGPGRRGEKPRIIVPGHDAGRGQLTASFLDWGRRFMSSLQHTTRRWPCPRGLEPPHVSAAARGLGHLAAGLAARSRGGGGPAGAARRSKSAPDLPLAARKVYRFRKPAGEPQRARWDPVLRNGRGRPNSPTRRPLSVG